MPKPTTLDGYTNQRTVDCGRVLVTLFLGLEDMNVSNHLSETKFNSMVPIKSCMSSVRKSPSDAFRK